MTTLPAPCRALFQPCDEAFAGRFPGALTKGRAMCYPTPPGLPVAAFSEGGDPGDNPPGVCVCNSNFGWTGRDCDAYSEAMAGSAVAIGVGLLLILLLGAAYANALNKIRLLRVWAKNAAGFTYVFTWLAYLSLVLCIVAGLISALVPLLHEEWADVTGAAFLSTTYFTCVAITIMSLAFSEMTHQRKYFIPLAIRRERACEIGVFLGFIASAALGGLAPRWVTVFIQVAFLSLAAVMNIVAPYHLFLRSCASLANSLYLSNVISPNRLRVEFLKSMLFLVSPEATCHMFGISRHDMSLGGKNYSSHRPARSREESPVVSQHASPMGSRTSSKTELSVHGGVGKGMMTIAPTTTVNNNNGSLTTIHSAGAIVPRPHAGSKSSIPSTDLETASPLSDHLDKKRPAGFSFTSGEDSKESTPVQSPTTSPHGPDEKNRKSGRFGTWRESSSTPAAPAQPHLGPKKESRLALFVNSMVNAASNAKRASTTLERVDSKEQLMPSRVGLQGYRPRRNRASLHQNRGVTDRQRKTVRFVCRAAKLGFWGSLLLLSQAAALVYTEAVAARTLDARDTVRNYALAFTGSCLLAGLMLGVMLQFLGITYAHKVEAALRRLRRRIRRAHRRDLGSKGLEGGYASPEEAAAEREADDEEDEDDEEEEDDEDATSSKNSKGSRGSREFTNHGGRKTFGIQNAELRANIAPWILQDEALVVKEGDFDPKKVRLANQKDVLLRASVAPFNVVEAPPPPSHVGHAGSGPLRFKSGGVASGARTNAQHKSGGGGSRGNTSQDDSPPRPSTRKLSPPPATPADDIRPDDFIQVEDIDDEEDVKAVVSPVFAREKRLSLVAAKPDDDVFTPGKT